MTRTGALQVCPPSSLRANITSNGSAVEFLRTESDIKGRVAPAALAYTFAEGLLVQSTMQHTGFAFLNMELDVHGPVLAGDTIHVECEVIELRATSKGRGLVRTFNEIKNQRGETVITYNPLRIMASKAMRDGGH